MADVVVVGAGRIGLPVIANLVRAGHRVRAVDIRAEREAAVTAVGAHWGGSTAEALGPTDVLMTVLPGSPELRAVMLGIDPPGLFAAARPGIWIDLTSAAPDLGAELAAAAQGSGIGYLEAPLGGGVSAAEQAALTLYLGGPAELVSQQLPLLQAIASPDRIHHLGGHGAGYTTKLLVNLLWFGQAVAVGEALLLGQRVGLSPAMLRGSLERSPAASRFLSDYAPALLTGDYAAGFGLDRCVEELDSLQRLASAVGSPFALSATVAEVHRQALRQFGAVDCELMGVAYLEQLAGRALNDPSERGLTKAQISQIGELTAD